ncbi:MAG TPA: hypothetical protein VFX78_01450 [Candidatus Eisenbacteria bacterium]|jgi:hypothetical protein|nr:hypothetical protein [Candidatus Eisenbacteria bacterium]
MIESTAQPRTEGPVAKAIERQTSKIPSDVFLWAALGFVGVSAFRSIRSRRDSGESFLSTLGPTLLMLGVYNKIVKLHGSDKYDEERQLAGQFGV